jgi:hypothetical protein
MFATGIAAKANGLCEINAAASGLRDDGAVNRARNFYKTRSRGNPAAANVTLENGAHNIPF